MTIITKPLTGEKKGDKLIVPLVENEELATAVSAKKNHHKFMTFRVLEKMANLN